MDGEPGADRGDADRAPLDRAVDSFLDWAEHAPGVSVGGLPPLPPLEGLGPGSTLGDFELGERLGTGGMGVIYEARQLSVPGRRVAIKILRALFSSERAAARFRREIAIVGSLDHPGIVPIVAAGVEEGVPYYAMKLVEGASVARLVRELKRSARGPGGSGASGGPDGGEPAGIEPVRAFVERAAPGWERPSSSAGEAFGSAWEGTYVRWAARFVLQAAEALQHAHDHGIVHRDVKPGNLMITPEGRPVLLDFGLAVEEGGEPLTLTGDFVGTLAYASPEQVRGDPVDGRGDVYSLGATLYELLALRRPFEAERRSEILRMVQSEDPPPLDDSLPADLRAICLRALAKSPERRYATPSLLAADLRAFLAGRPVQAKLPGLVPRAARFLRRHPRWSAAAAVAVLLFAGLRARSHVHAAERAGEGGRHAAAFLEERGRLAGLLAGWQELRSDGTGFSAEREELSGRIAEAGRLADEGFEAAEAALHAALELVSGHRRARRELARLYAARLELELARCRDLLDPVAFDRLQDDLARYDDRGEHAHLLERLGRVTLASVPPGAHVAIRRLAEGADGPLEHEGAAPLADLALEEGSYVALFRLEGYEEARLPFLVRRDACYLRPGSPNRAFPGRELTVELLPAGSVPKGYVHVPAGWTLVEDAPPRWDHVGSFLIGRFEVTNADVLRWMNASLELAPYDPFGLADAASFGHRPRFANDPASLHVEPDPAGSPGRWRLVRGFDPAWPVRGLTPMEMAQYVLQVPFLEPFESSGAPESPTSSGPAGWYDGLPTRAEWIRAARGADARPYPFGSEFDWSRCAGYPSVAEQGRDPWPVPVGSFPADVSPFGVRDLAGSIAEVTCEGFGRRPGINAVCGGSFEDDRSERMRTTAVTGIRNEPRPFAGFRLVKRPRPAWMLTPDEPPAPFRDDFERPDSDTVGNGWIEMANVPPSPFHGPERCFLEDGKLVCEGGKGDFSSTSTAWHRIHVDPERFVVRARLSVPETRESGAGNRSMAIELHPTFGGPDDASLSLACSSEGRLCLLWSAPGARRSSTADLTVASSDPLELELVRRDGRFQARVWPAGDPRPDPPQAEIDAPPTLWTPRYLGITAQNLQGVRVEVEEIEVE